MKAKSANESPRYRKFITGRNLALEKLHLRAQREVGFATDQFLVRVLETVAFRYDHTFSAKLMEDLDRALLPAVDACAVSILIAFGRMRRNVTVLGYMGEVEGMARALGKPLSVKKMRLALAAAQVAPSPSGGHVYDRAVLALSRIKRAVLDAVQTAKLLGETKDEALVRVRKEFPKPLRYKRPPRALRKLRESASDPVEVPQLIVGFMDEDQWADMVKDHNTEFLPKFRGPDSVFDVDMPDGSTEEWFGWEIEKELTQDFVERVRAGQVQAARDNGVKDFIWVSVLDDKTDTCCYWRHGLTTEEIRAELAKKKREDECAALVPPAHFNCRCDLAPMLEDLPEETPPDFGDFESWLNQAT